MSNNTFFYFAEALTEKPSFDSLPTPPQSPEHACVDKDDAHKSNGQDTITPSSSETIKDQVKTSPEANKRRKRDPIGQILDSLCNESESSTLGPSAFSPIVTSSISQLSPLTMLAQSEKRCIQSSPSVTYSPYHQQSLLKDVFSPDHHHAAEQMSYIQAEQTVLQQNANTHYMFQTDFQSTLQSMYLLQEKQNQIMAYEAQNRLIAERNFVGQQSNLPLWMAWFKSSAPESMTSYVKDTRIPPPPRYQCDACKKSYSTFGGLSKHKQFHCVSHIKKEFNCKFCEKAYGSLGALKMHIRTHTLPCKCKLCGKAFSRPWLLQGHIRTHTGEKPFKCMHCARAFADRSNLRAHLQTHSDIKKYGCKNCTKTFSRMSLLLKHEDGSCLGMRR